MTAQLVRVPEARSAGDDIDTLVKTLDVLGLDRFTESIEHDAAVLDDSGVKGESYVQLPRGVMKLQDIISGINGVDSAEYPDGREYSPIYVYEGLWTPGNDPDGYVAADIGNLGVDRRDEIWRPHVRVAVHNPDCPDEPLLHFLDMPFDAKYAKGKKTQLDAMAEAAAEYGEAHPGFEMVPLNGPGIAMLALARRLKGEAMPTEGWGFMLDATLPRKSPGGGSVIGRITAEGDDMRFGGDYGYKSDGGGVGLSTGPTDISIEGYTLRA